MISSKFKINSTEFKKFYNKGIKKNGSYLRISFIYKNENEVISSKYAVVAGKKVSKLAVLRNKNKRKVYNIIQETYPQFCHLKYIFIFIKKDLSTIDRNIIKNEIESLLFKNNE